MLRVPLLLNVDSRWLVQTVYLAMYNMSTLQTVSYVFYYLLHASCFRITNGVGRFGHFYCF